VREVWIPSPHYSTSRGPYNKIVLHTTEGAMKIRDLGAWFQNPGAQCSSHHGADNYERGVFGAYVYENYSAWTQGNANGYCLSLEMCAYASWTRSTWLNDKAVLLDNAAEWVRYCVDKYGIPWTVLNDYQAQDPNVRGICEHVNFGSWGSGHHDCGTGFPMDVVIDKAKSGGGGTAPATGGILMTAATTFDGNDREWSACVWTDGKINFLAPGAQAWAACDPTQNPNSVRSGADIAYSPGNDTLVITYVNSSGDVCTYRRPASGGSNWSWSSKKGDAK